ncbi:MAG: T9SS type A sorting domain-containing protein [Bacteroidales bacterium]|nr:T9SS type A sorting domain-containing protein [Bacteroidales bacterium]
MKKPFVFLFALAACHVAVCQEGSTTGEWSVIGNTSYDLQTARAMQNRIYGFEDGSAGAVWNMGFLPPQFSDLGIGYNYYDGNNWGSQPIQPITSARAVNPSYTQWGAEGEIVISEGQNGLIICRRPVKGTGTWQESLLPGTGLMHPVVVTSGPDHHTIHLLCLVADISFVPTGAQPARGFIHYSRSSDGGATWEIQHQLINGIGPSGYLGFTVGSYVWAHPRAGTLAFLAGDYLTDLVLMKSIDNGNTWQKTVVWENPYPFFEIFSLNSDSFYCNDGGITLSLNNSGMAHAAFGLSRVYSSILQTNIWYEKKVDGIAYWNETMQPFSNNINALNPYGHPDSELIEDYNYIGWTQDIDNNGVINLLDSIVPYPTPGVSTMPQLFMDEYGHICLLYSSLTETYDNGVCNFRHIWVRVSPDNGITWGDFYDLNNDLVFIFSEFVYPVAANRYSDFYLHLYFMEDYAPGLAALGQHMYADNHVINYRVEVLYPPPPWLYVDFTADHTVVNAGDTVHFINLSGGYPEPFYSWTFEGGIPSTSSQVHPVVVYPVPGSYDVSLQGYNFVYTMTEYKSDYITILTTAEGESAGRFHLFPNPPDQVLIIEWLTDVRSDAEISVVDVNGRVINEATVNTTYQGWMIEISNLRSGTFFIRIITGGRSLLYKIIKK